MVKKVVFTFGEALIAEIAAYAEKTGLKKAEIVRQALRMYFLAKKEKEENGKEMV